VGIPSSTPKPLVGIPNGLSRISSSGHTKLAQWADQWTMLPKKNLWLNGYDAAAYSGYSHPP